MLAFKDEMYRWGIVTIAIQVAHDVDLAYLACDWIGVYPTVICTEVQAAQGFGNSHFERISLAV
jgi:hypothetical protein